MLNRTICFNRIFLYLLTMTLSQGILYKSRANPPKKKGPVVIIKTKPYKAWVYLNATFMGTSPVKLTLSPGKNLLFVAKKGFQPALKYITLAKNMNHNITISLNRERANQVPSLVPIEGLLQKKHKIKKILHMYMQTFKYPSLQYPAQLEKQIVVQDQLLHRATRLSYTFKEKEITMQLRIYIAMYYWEVSKYYQYIYKLYQKRHPKKDIKINEILSQIADFYKNYIGYALTDSHRIIVRYHTHKNICKFYRYLSRQIPKDQTITNNYKNPNQSKCDYTPLAYYNMAIHYTKTKQKAIDLYYLNKAINEMKINNIKNISLLNLIKTKIKQIKDQAIIQKGKGKPR